MIERLGETLLGMLLTLAIVMVILLGIAGFFYFLPGFQQLAQGKPFFLTEFESRNRIVQECLASEQYSRDECIQLAIIRRSR